MRLTRSRKDEQMDTEDVLQVGARMEGGRDGPGAENTGTRGKGIGQDELIMSGGQVDRQVKDEERDDRMKEKGRDKMRRNTGRDESEVEDKETTA
jgi:hypothetical protein